MTQRTNVASRGQVSLTLMNCQRADYTHLSLSVLSARTLSHGMRSASARPSRLFDAGTCLAHHDALSLPHPSIPFMHNHFPAFVRKVARKVCMDQSVATQLSNGRRREVQGRRQARGQSFHFDLSPGMSNKPRANGGTNGMSAQLVLIAFKFKFVAPVIRATRARR